MYPLLFKCARMNPNYTMYLSVYFVHQRYKEEQAIAPSFLALSLVEEKHRKANRLAM